MKRTEFMYVFQLSKMIMLEVNYYTLGSNKEANFTMSADEFIKNKRDYARCGQCQEELTEGFRVAHNFVMKWNSKHLCDLTDDEYVELNIDLLNLKNTYNYIEKTRETFANTYEDIRFREIVELSKKNLKK